LYHDRCAAKLKRVQAQEEKDGERIIKAIQEPVKHHEKKFVNKCEKENPFNYSVKEAVDEETNEGNEKKKKKKRKHEENEKEKRKKEKKKKKKSNKE
jgi:hypothetical protein